MIGVFTQTGRPANTNKLAGLTVGRLILTGGPGPTGPASTVPGPEGQSAYAAAVAGGFEGTVEEWLLSLKGDPGEGAAITSEMIVTALGYTPETEGEAADLLGVHEAASDPHPGYVLESNIGVTVAGLVDGKVPSAQLPGYVDDVLEYADLAALPVTGESGKIYITLDTNKEYRWSGSVYVELVASPGSTDAVPEGSTNLYFTIARVRAAVLTGLNTALTGAVSATDTVLEAFGRLQNSIASHFGAGGSAHADVTAGGAAGFMTGTQATKLAGIATGATANDTDANLKARGNHTGTQTASTISDFSAAADARIAAATITNAQIAQNGATTSQALVWNGSSWAPASISASPGGSTTQLQYNNAGAFGGLPGVTYASNTVLHTSQAASAIPFAVQAATSQTGNLTEWRNSVGTMITRVASNGLIAITKNGDTALTIFDANTGLGRHGSIGGLNVFGGSGATDNTGDANFGTSKFTLKSTYNIVWTASSLGAAAQTGWCQKVAGVTEANNGTRGSYSGSAFGAGSQTVAQLPTASTCEGAHTMVTDSTQTLTAGVGATVTGGGSNKVPVHSDGTNWRIG